MVGLKEMSITLKLCIGERSFGGKDEGVVLWSYSVVILVSAILQ